MKGAPVVVVARQHVHRRLQRCEQLAQLFVLLVGRVVREVAGQEHRIGLGPDRANRLDRRGEPRHGLIVEPLGADVRIAELREEERGPAGHAT